MQPRKPRKARKVQEEDFFFIRSYRSWLKLFLIQSAHFFVLAVRSDSLHLLWLRGNEV